VEVQYGTQNHRWAADAAVAGGVWRRRLRQHRQHRNLSRQRWRIGRRHRRSTCGLAGGFLRTGTVSAIVENVDTAEAQIRQIAESRGGYVLGSQVNGDDEQRRASISFKVPATRFDEAMAELTKLALEVESQDVQGQDVTDEFVDLESRLRNLRAVEARLIDFLQQAQKVEEALQVNQQLSEIQGQIEQAEGRITYLKESAAYSTINVSLRGQPVVVVSPDKSWSPGATARNAANGVLAFAQVVADILIVFAVWFPIWLPGLILGLWLWRRSRRAPAATTQP
jgi:hypothetical protein